MLGRLEAQNHCSCRGVLRYFTKAVTALEETETRHARGKLVGAGFSTPAA